MEQLLEQVREAEAALGEERMAREASRAEVARLSQEVEGCQEEQARERDSMAMQLKVRATIVGKSNIALPSLHEKLKGQKSNKRSRTRRLKYFFCHFSCRIKKLKLRL